MLCAWRVGDLWPDGPHCLCPALRPSTYLLLTTTTTFKPQEDGVEALTLQRRFDELQRQERMRRAAAMKYWTLETDELYDRAVESEGGLVKATPQGVVAAMGVTGDAAEAVRQRWNSALSSDLRAKQVQAEGQAKRRAEAKRKVKLADEGKSEAAKTLKTEKKADARAKGEQKVDAAKAETSQRCRVSGDAASSQRTCDESAVSTHHDEGAMSFTWNQAGADGAFEAAIALHGNGVTVATIRDEMAHTMSPAPTESQVKGKLHRRRAADSRTQKEQQTWTKLESVRKRAGEDERAAEKEPEASRTVEMQEPLAVKQRLADAAKGEKADAAKGEKADAAKGEKKAAREQKAEMKATAKKAAEDQRNEASIKAADRWLAEKKADEQKADAEKKAAEDRKAEAETKAAERRVADNAAADERKAETARAKKAEKLALPKAAHKPSPADYAYAMAGKVQLAAMEAASSDLFGVNTAAGVAAYHAFLDSYDVSGDVADAERAGMEAGAAAVPAALTQVAVVEAERVAFVAGLNEFVHKGEEGAIDEVR